MSAGDTSFFDPGSDFSMDPSTDFFDSSSPDIFGTSTDPFAIAPDPGSTGDIWGWDPNLGFGSGADTAVNDVLQSSGTPGSDNTVIQFDDGSIYDTQTGEIWDANGNPISTVGIGTDGTIKQFADGSILDTSNGNRWDAKGNPITSSPGARSSGNFGGLPAIGKSSQAAGAGINLSKALGSLGTALAGILGKPTATPANIRAQQTALGPKPILNAQGNSAFLIMVLVLGFFLLRGK